MSWRLVAAVAVVLALPAQAQTGSPAPEPTWTEAGRQGVVRLVLVPLEQARDRAAYDRQIARICAPEGRCFINFYTNSTGAALATPLPDAVFQEATAVFRRSEKHAAEQFRWACRLALDPGACF